MDSILRFELSASTKKYFQAAEKEFGRDALYAGIERFFDKQASRGATRIASTQLSGQVLKTRSGNLKKEVIGRGLRVNGVPAMRVGIFRGPALRYAGVQEYGTKGKNPSSPYPTITPKKAKSLAIPLDGGPAVHPSGVAKYDSPRDFPGGLHFVPFRRGVAIGALYPESEIERLKGGLSLRDLQAAYLLVTKVDIKPHFFLRTGFEKFLPEVSKELGKYLKTLVQSARQ